MRHQIIRKSEKLPCVRAGKLLICERAAGPREAVAAKIVRAILGVHCYFHLVHRHERILDETGIEVSDLEAAHYQAIKAIQELRQEGGSEDIDWRDWHLEVVDESGAVLLSIPLDTAQH